MLKRITKISSLLVCAASVISMVPTMAADVKKFDSQEGTIYNSKAKSAGIYIDGEINGNDETGYFFTPDGTYHEIDGVDEGLNLDNIYLGRYAALDDGDTVIDINDNFKVIDYNTKEDLIDDVSSTAKKVLKKDNDGRFDESEFDYLKTADNGGIIEQAISSSTLLTSFKYKLDDPFVIGGTTVKDSDTVYVDYEGKYVDADYNLGSLKVITTGGSITFKNTDDTYDLDEDGTTYEYKAVISNNKKITEAGDYVYRYAKLSIYKKQKNASDDTYVNVTDQVGYGSKGYNDFVTSGATYIDVVQKFSKPSDSDKTIDGIKYCKDSSIYFIADEDGDSEVILGKSASASAAEVGATYNSSDKVTITANSKTGMLVSAYLSQEEKKVYAQNLELKSKQGFNYVDLGDAGDVDTDVTDSIYTSGGTVYVLDGGYVKQWDTSSEDFNKLYKVDGGMDHISVGSSNFIIVWNEDNENYSIINNTTSTSTTATTGATTTTDATKTTVTAGWVKADNGSWSYAKADGTKATGWLLDGANWYFLKADGVMATGWVNDNGTWYFLKANGAMATGWINDNGTWYFLNSSGAMLVNTIIDGYALGASGAWIK